MSEQADKIEMKAWWQALARSLKQPFLPEKVHWRVGSTNKDKTRGMVLAYIDARDVMDRLDDVVGPGSWRTFVEHQGPVAMTTLQIWCPFRKEWIGQCDGAGATDFEGEKGRISDSLKRTAVRWGVGRYLYGLKSPWVEIEQRGRTSIIKPRELEKLRQHLERVSAELARGADVELDDEPGSDVEHPDSADPAALQGGSDAAAGTNREVCEIDGYPLPIDQITKSMAQEILKHAKRRSEVVGVNGLELVDRALHELEIPQPKKKTVAAFVEHLTWVLGKGDMKAVEELISEMEAI